MALANPYCTVAELRAQMGDSGARLDAALLERAINAASRAIEAHCGREFWQDSATVERTYRVQDPSLCFIDDVSTRTGLVVKTGTDGVNFPTTLTSGTDFILEPRNADKYASSTFAAYAFTEIRMVGSQVLTVDPHRDTLAVTARYGWSTIPSVVTEVCVLLAERRFKLKDAPFGIAGLSDFGPVRVARADGDILSRLDAAGLVLPGFA